MDKFRWIHFCSNSLLIVLFLFSGCGDAKENNKKPPVETGELYNGILIVKSTIENEKSELVLLDQKTGDVLKRLSKDGEYALNFTISSKGALFFAVSGSPKKRPPLVGSQFSSVRVEFFDLENVQNESKNITTGQFVAQPQKLELNATEKFLCFADIYGHIFVYDIYEQKFIDLIEDADVSKKKIYGKFLNESKTGFFCSELVGNDENGRYKYKEIVISLPE